jgi:hypothetical protein
MLPGDADDHGWLADRRVAVARWRRRKSGKMVDATLHAGMWACLAAIALIAFLSGRLQQPR